LVNNTLDKHKTWGRKLAVILVNALLTLSLLPLPLKRLTTGSWFFSIKGKSYEAGEKAVKSLNRMTIF
jgi:uncharacterized membrane protein YdjX (TVP38/TMEM64 family)